MVVASATSIVQTWLPAIGGLIGGLLLGAGALVAGLEYRLKAKAQRVEANVRLADTFARLVPIADGRDGSTHLAEGAVTHLLSSSSAPDADEFRRRIAPAVVPGVVGLSAQITAIASIADLVIKFPDELKEPGTRALVQLKTMAESARHEALIQAVAEAQERVATAS